MGTVWLGTVRTGKVTYHTYLATQQGVTVQCIHFGQTPDRGKLTTHISHLV